MNMNFQLDFMKNKQQMIIFIALVSAIALVLYVYLLLGPQVVGLTETLGKLGTTSSELKTTEITIAKKGEYIMNIEAYKEKVESYEKRLPAEQEIPNLLESLSIMARQANIKIIGITPITLTTKDQSAQKGRMYKEIPILISAKSGYHELGAFLSKLESADRFMKVVDIEIKASKLAPKKHDIELIVCTYVSLEGIK